MAAKRKRNCKPKKHGKGCKKAIAVCKISPRTGRIAKNTCVQVRGGGGKKKPKSRRPSKRSIDAAVRRTRVPSLPAFPTPRPFQPRTLGPPAVSGLGGLGRYGKWRRY